MVTEQAISDVQRRAGVRYQVRGDVMDHLVIGSVNMVARDLYLWQVTSSLLGSGEVSIVQGEAPTFAAAKAAMLERLGNDVAALVTDAEF